MISNVGILGTLIEDTNKVLYRSTNGGSNWTPVSNITAQRPDVKSQMSNVELEVYNASGKRVDILVNEKLSPGSYGVEFNGSNLSTGVYFYRVTTKGFLLTKKMLLIK